MGAPFVSITLAIIVAVASYPARAVTTPEEDFAARCGEPGVVLCKGFDTESDIAANIQPAYDDTMQGSHDTTTKTSGAGSLRFTLRAGESDSNIGGAYSGSMGHTFNVGDTMYVQWRQRVTPEFLSNNTNFRQCSVKQINIHDPSSTCQGRIHNGPLWRR
jgi:hypothetical protein